MHAKACKTPNRLQSYSYRSSLSFFKYAFSLLELLMLKLNLVLHNVPDQNIEYSLFILLSMGT